MNGRDPDVFPAGAPFEMFTVEQAERAFGAAETLYNLVYGIIHGT